ncbi:hypothetical protein [Antrihabitans sp. YC2-6]|uniref:hypothetical protein n=1 Tax=Antrihabitans sp. YC2-6 TaxID=2799498 RepID=UPI0018F6FA9B|nr:hypothetical protein [Antrihabitans sp. YC2-6]MBJ8346417.1 hypothetical protein [Antrihabitans sp. YC2-6]
MTKNDLRHIIGATVVAALLVSVFVVAFAWPAANLRPRDVPIGVAGPAPFVAQVEQRLSAAQPGGFEITAYENPAAARDAIKAREIYGAIVAGQPPTVLTAPAGSAAVAQALEGIAAGINGVTPVPTEQVVPLPAEDPRGIGFSAGALPMVLGALLTGIISFLLLATVGARLTALTTGSIAAALVAAALLGPWLGILPGAYVETSAAIALGFFAGGAMVVGWASLIGPPGIGVAAVLLMVLGNPLSGAPSAPELLPTGWGALGQWLPPGALTSLLRSVAYFDGAGGARPAAILAAWAVLGVTLAALGARRAKASPEPLRPPQQPAPTH